MIELPEPRLSNCLFWAVRVWRRYGGYLVLRQSHHAWWMPHILWMPRSRIGMWGYTPVKPKRWMLQVFIHCLRFRGHVVKEE